MGEQVSAYFGNVGVASTLGYVKSGKLRALAVSSSRRVNGLPGTPTLAESGLPGDNVVELNVFLPKGAPADIEQRLGRAVHAAVNDLAVKQKLLKFGLGLAGTTPRRSRNSRRTRRAG